MFSYRHAFHAGNHADVLKHTVLIAVLKHLTLKEAPLAVFDTHAGAGLYRLDGDYAQTSGEAAQGYLRLVGSSKDPSRSSPSQTTGADSVNPNATPPARLPPALQDYLELIGGFNLKGSNNIYPGSPFIIQRFLRERDKLKLFELHPTDSKTLTANIAQLEAGRQVSVLREDGFEALKRFLPPPQRRALVLMDPSYELKSDYALVADAIADSLARFAIGTYVIWYPIIPRPEAHDLPRRLKSAAVRAERSWLNATLTVKSSKMPSSLSVDAKRPGLPASGVFVINPPHTLKECLGAALPKLVEGLQQDANARMALESS